MDIIKVRKATESECKYFETIWDKSFSGFVVEFTSGSSFVRTSSVSVVLKEGHSWTPSGSYRISDDKSKLIKAAYSRYIGFDLDDNLVAVREYDDIDDTFRF